MLHLSAPGPLVALWELVMGLVTSGRSLILLLVLGPITLVLMFISILKRVWKIGTIHSNVYAFVNTDGEVPIDPVLTLSASELSRRIRDPMDPLTAVQLVNMCIKHINIVNPSIQAMVAVRFEDARREAAEADAAVLRGEVPPNDCDFWGVPIVIKECFEYPNLPFTAGLWGRRGVIGSILCPAVDSVVRRTGAIVLGSTNVSEACMWHESINHVYGCTHNPYDLRRTAGGSSGGCGAAVASCCVPLAITSDVGGSTRIPALYNGLFGHKPSGGSISNENTIPTVGAGDVQRYCQLGPTSRHAEDLWPLLKAMLRDDAPVDLTVEDQVDMSRITVYVTKSNLTTSHLSSSLHPDICSGIDAAIAYLESKGATIVHHFESLNPNISKMFLLLNAFRIWAAMMAHHRHEPFRRTIREGLSTVRFWLWELFSSIFDLSNNTFPAVLLAAVECVSDLEMMNEENRSMRELGESIKATLHDLLRPVRDENESRLRESIIILPSLPTPAPFHCESLLRVFDTANTSFFNVMELPSTAVPLGLEKNNCGGRCRMPVGFQIVGGYGRDKVTISVANELERAGIAGWVPPAP